MVSDPADEIRIPAIRSNPFINEEEGVWIVLLLDGQKSVVMRAEEGFLPIEFVSGSLHVRKRERMRSMKD